MRVLVYSPDAGTRPGHSFMYAARICQCLTSRGQDVTLLTTPGFTDQYREAYGEAAPFLVIEKTNFDFSKTVGHATSVQMFRYMWRRITYSTKMLYELGKELRSGEYTVLHCLDNPEMVTTLCFGLLLQLLGPSSKTTKWFLNIHPGDISFKTGGTSLLRRLYKGLSGWALRILLRKGWVTAAFVHGEQIRNALLSAWGSEEFRSKVILAPYGVGGLLPVHVDRLEARRRLGLPEQAFIVLSFGIIRRDKRVDDIIRAISLVGSAVLVIAGMPTEVEEKEIRQWVEEAHISERTVLHLRYIPEEEVATYFSVANVLVLAHDTGFPGQSGPLHLACSFGVPVVVSDVGDIGRFVRENGVGEVFPPRDWKVLAKLLAYFHATDQDTYQTYVQREREIATRLSWDNTVERYLEAYTTEER